MRSAPSLSPQNDLYDLSFGVFLVLQGLKIFLHKSGKHRFYGPHLTPTVNVVNKTYRALCLHEIATCFFT